MFSLGKTLRSVVARTMAVASSAQLVLDKEAPFRRQLIVNKLEYPIVEHCNLSCIHCDHASPLMNPRFTSLEQYDRDLTICSRVLHTHEFCVLGGEPLLHQHLLRFLAIARDRGISDIVTLVTNGALLHKAPPGMWKLIDKLWLSIYPRIVIRPDLETIRRMCADNGVMLYVRNITEFGQRLINHRNSDSESVGLIYSQCKIAHEWRCYSIYNGVFYKCSIAPFTSRRLSLRNVGYEGEHDGVRLDGNPTLRAQIEEYLRCTRPLDACHYCLGTSGSNVPHRQLKRNEVLDSLRSDDPPVNQLINLSGG
jgi:hypothetical protein